MKRNIFAMPRAQYQLNPAEDKIFDSYLLSERWNMHPKAAILRARLLKIPEVKFNSRSFGWRLSNILIAEEKLTEPRETIAAE
jgi:hypothetical protein